MQLFEESSTVGNIVTCKAAVCWEAGVPPVIEQIQVAPPQQGEVRIRMMYSSACHTDCHSMAGLDEYTCFPTILGHEGAGIVESVGEGVTSLAPGDPVVPMYIAECGECGPCIGNKTNMCVKSRAWLCKGVMADGTTRFSCRGKNIGYYMSISAFSQYTVCPEEAVAKVDGATEDDLRRLCLLGCGVPTGYGAVSRVAKVESGSTVAVFGLGCIGLSCIQAAKHAGASRIIAIDLNPGRADLARVMGATEFINPLDHPNKPTQQLLQEATAGGVDYSFECAGGNVNVMRTAIESSHPTQGTCILISLAPSGQQLSLNPMDLLTGRTVRGCIFGGIKGRTDIPHLADDYFKGKLKLDEYVNLEVPLDNINKALMTMSTGKCIRPVIDMR
ncbi:alcohol dehydrogenase class 3 [Piptocephalis cylindrospora]|uniref:Alcohol dehydrogenase class 3 n=1 Tax=Piptocephalis cylindrospora TaxID=1907219 RepID=A0A4V1IYA1_9FUNG|nr:alcohol dehydrogenase class 3 [Piptocephalis cylindrospora]|eukprot:RKP13839.1 alcohol dehydrogenase class 3 [Piptocephalis cylindrospora]